MKLLIKALESIRDDGPQDRRWGICMNLRDFLGAEAWCHYRSTVYVYCTEWPEGSRSKYNPVPGDEHYEDLWHNPARNTLLNYMIERANDQAND